MKYVRLFIFSFLLLFIVVFGITLFIPSKVRISKAINIKSDAVAVWSQVDDMRKWPSWNPFFAQLDFTSVDQLDTSGGMLKAMRVQGTEIIWQEMKPDLRLAAMKREGRNPVYNGWKCIQIPGSDSTTVQWYMDFKLSWYPWEKFSSLLFERSYGPQMQQGLNNLKQIIDSNHSSIK